ncbi:Quinone oxidoreductase [Cercospora beticola]|uniref:Quinone oxidoreductase n=1 Tax=Cercospora beticola TaxID=122368 RepID=A0A2G5HUR3_CERBT|nr:Quinone oxidoreductase [Cercospora beticola]PIA96261.1 Quinone oxidoreductase [Cercospora beticola]WPB07162.1 hypothetical protein RHO25_011822 [Cercospora beticola]
MSIATVRPADPMSFEYHENDLDLGEDIDWGTATPISRVNVLDDRKLANIISKCELLEPARIPQQQKALILHDVKTPYVLTRQHTVPEIQNGNELLIQIVSVGLNPIDWKSVDYGFGIPSLPYIAGRDFAGIVVKAPRHSHIREGDTVICGSTDYRDVRKAAYQEYAIASDHTVCRLPEHIPVTHGSALGVAFVAASLALGVCLGLKLPDIAEAKGSKGPDIRQIVRRTALGDLPSDTVSECLSMPEFERPVPGECLVIWGGSSTSALILSQLAHLAGLKVILVVDVAKHGARMMESKDFVLVDSHNAARASDIIRNLTKGQLRFGVDTVGKPTAEALAKSLQVNGEKKSHIVGLAALPKERIPGIVYHSVPVKLFHEVRDVGLSLTAWLEQALEHSVLSLPVVESAPGGLEGINAALDRMRQGQISGKRLVVPL